MELPTNDAGMEDGSLSCCRQHDGVETSQGIEDVITMVIIWQTLANHKLFGHIDVVCL